MRRLLPTALVCYYAFTVACLALGPPMTVYGGVTESWAAVVSGLGLSLCGMRLGYAISSTMLANAQSGSLADKLETLIATASLAGRGKAAN